MLFRSTVRLQNPPAFPGALTAKNSSAHPWSWRCLIPGPCGSGSFPACLACSKRDGDWPLFTPTPRLKFWMPTRGFFSSAAPRPMAKTPCSACTTSPARRWTWTPRSRPVRPSSCSRRSRSLIQPVWRPTRRDGCGRRERPAGSPFQRGDAPGGPPACGPWWSHCRPVAPLAFLASPITLQKRLSD